MLIQPEKDGQSSKSGTLWGSWWGRWGRTFM